MDAVNLPSPRQFRVPIDNRWGAGEMAVMDFGDPQRPVDLIFSHANGFNAATYRSLLSPLSASLRIWAPDLRGHGLSRLPTFARPKTSWQDHRDDLLSALGTIDGPTDTKLKIHIFVANKGDYYELADGVPQNQQ